MSQAYSYPTSGCIRLNGHAGACLNQENADRAWQKATDPDTLIDANTATEGAAWLLRHRCHVLTHNERGFHCMDCEGTNDATWLTAAAWNERVIDAQRETLSEISRIAQRLVSLAEAAR